MKSDIVERIGRASGNTIGVATGLLAARRSLGDDNLNKFLDKVQETGEALWDRFRAFQKMHPSADFVHFVVFVIKEVRGA